MVPKTGFASSPPFVEARRGLAGPRVLVLYQLTLTSCREKKNMDIERSSPMAECALCRGHEPRNELVRGTSLWACRRCVERGLVETLRGAGEMTEGQALLSAYSKCSYCGRATPPRSLHEGHAAEEPAAICILCLGSAYRLVTDTNALNERRRLNFSKSEDPDAASLVADHFDDLGPAEIATSSRTFASYLRPDLQTVLDRLMEARGARCVGLHTSYNFETISYASINRTGREGVRVAPLQYEDVDIAADEPVRCVRSALWLVPDDATPHAVLLTRAHTHGRSEGWHVEVAVPVGRAGQELTQAYFRELEESVRISASYRGKILSLECEPHYGGMAGGSIVVHRLPPVARGDVILPDSTLSLLERNVFRFFEQRARLLELGLPVKKGLLFYGPPGTGKTHTIRYLAGALPEHTTLLITAEQVASIGEYTALARLLSPAIVVIEDVDLIARDRTTLETPLQESLLNRLLNEMDGLRENAEVLFVLTTNRPETLEAALAGRPGRIDQAVEFPLPDDRGRMRLVDLYRRDLLISESVKELVVRRTDGVSAAFIKELMRRSAQSAVQRDGQGKEATREDVEGAIQEMLFDGGRLNAALLGAGASVSGV
jgi:hypothetical protein